MKIRRNTTTQKAIPLPDYISKDTDIKSYSSKFIPYNRIKYTLSNNSSVC